MSGPKREHRLRPRREPRQDRAAETRARLLDAAAEVFETRGYDGGTTNHIATAAAMSVGSLYQYFPNKDAILVELMVDHVAEGGDRVRHAIDAWRAEGSDVDALARTVVDELLRLHREMPVLHQILMTRVPLPPDVAARIEALEVEFVAELAELLDQVSDLSGEEAAVRAAMAASAINALVHQQVARPEARIPDVRFAEETTKLVVAYLTS